jgi:hypothetical protein
VVTRGAAPPRTRVHALLQDGSLALSVADGAAALVAPWIPADDGAAEPAPDARWIHVRSGDDTRPAPPPGPPGLEFLGLRFWFDGEGERAVLLTGDRSLTGEVDLARGAAEICINPRDADPQARPRTECALNASAALLLGRREQVLVHAAAFVAPRGRAWLLAGDTCSGKSSTCANLIRAGWDYLGDDQVIIGEDAAGGGLVVEGWHRPFNIDDGFESGTSVRYRSPTDPATLGCGGWRRRASLGGVLFPRVESGEPTRLEPMTRAEALAGIIRQAPWLMADAGAAPAVLALMRRIVAAPVHRLRLGWDAYREPAALIDALEPALGGASTRPEWSEDA